MSSPIILDWIPDREQDHVLPRTSCTLTYHDTYKATWLVEGGKATLQGKLERMELIMYLILSLGIV